MKNKPLTPHQVDKALTDEGFTKSVRLAGRDPRPSSGYVINYTDRGAIRVTHRAWSMTVTNEAIGKRLDDYAAALTRLGYQIAREGLTLTVRHD